MQFALHPQRLTKLDFAMTQISIHYTGDIVTKKEAIELSLTRYFTGKPCKNGHIAQRQTKKSTCCECSKIKTREFDLNKNIIKNIIKTTVVGFQKIEKSAKIKQIITKII